LLSEEEDVEGLGTQGTIAKRRSFWSWL